MTTCGCGLLWLTVAGAVLLAAAPGLGWLPTAMIAALAIFLLLQTLRWILPRNP